MNGMDPAGTQVRALVTELLRDRLSVETPETETDLIESGLLDSLALVTLISAIEETFACELPLDDFDIDNFRSIDRICQYLYTSNVLATRGA